MARVNDIKVTGVKFTQYLRPHGRPKEVYIDLPKEFEDMADKLISQGYHFDIEVLTTGQIHMSCENDSLDSPVIVNAICDNGPKVVTCVERIISSAVLFMS